MSARLAKWFFFSIIFGLLPLALAYIKAVSVGPSVTLQEIVARGGLLLVAVGLSTAAVAELIATGKERAALKYTATGSCMAVVAAASLYYPVVSDAYTVSLVKQKPLEANLNTDFAFWFSIALYGTAIFGSLVGVWVAESESGTGKDVQLENNVGPMERRVEKHIREEEQGQAEKGQHDHRRD